MGAYSEHVVPRIVNVVGNMKVAHPQRRRVCEGLSGEVIEIGFGSGLNVPYYPATVTRVAAIEPADLGWKLPPSGCGGDSPIERNGLDGLRCLPRRQLRHRPVDVDDVHDPRPRGRAARATESAEARRHPALRQARPDARREGAGLAAPLRADQQRLFGGCHLTRPIVDFLTDGGFTVTESTASTRRARRSSSARTRWVSRGGLEVAV